MTKWEEEIGEITVKEGFSAWRRPKQQSVEGGKVEKERVMIKGGHLDIREPGELGNPREVKDTSALKLKGRPGRRSRWGLLGPGTISLMYT